MSCGALLGRRIGESDLSNRTSLIIVAAFAAVIIPLWVWGVASLLRGRREVRERSLLGGRLRTARSGWLFSSRWEPETRPAFLVVAVGALAGLVIARLLGIPPILALVIALVGAGGLISRMQQTIGVDSWYARAAIAVCVGTVIATALSLV